MPTLTVQITNGRDWYRKAVGKYFEAAKDKAVFRLVDISVLTIDKDDCVVTAVHYEAGYGQAIPV